MTRKEIEGAIGNHADWIEHLAARMDELAAAQIKTDAYIAETNRTLRELGEKTDKRIADLVGAIGKLIEARS